MRLARVDLAPEELMLLTSLARGRHAELLRVVQGMEEAEGEDLQRHRAMRALAPQIEAMEDLLLKLDGAAADLRGGEAASP